MNSDITTAYQVLDKFRGLGNQQVRGAGFQLVVQTEAPYLPEVNYLTVVRARTPAEMERTLGLADKAFEKLSFRMVFCDLETPPEFEARLLFEGYQHTPELQMLLTGPLLDRGPELDIRVCSSSKDFAKVAALLAVEHAEERAARRIDDSFPDLVAMTAASRRRKGPSVTTWLAYDNGAPCGYLSSWAGIRGLAKLEYGFTRPESRGRGVATALFAKAIDDVRSRGAHSIVVGARTQSTTTKRYAKLGFEPWFIRRAYIRR